MKNLKLILTLTILSTIFSCVNPEEYGTPDLSGECTNLQKTKNVTDITSVATNNFQKWTGDDVIEAYVTSSDEGGNFFKSISLISTDGITGFSVPADDYNLYTKYEPGRKVSILMKDRYYSRSQSSVVIGSLFNNETPSILTDDAVGRLTQDEYKRVIVRSCDKVDENTLVNNFTISQALNNNNLNKLIEFDNVQFLDGSVGKKFYDPSVNSIGGATNHTITDAAGSTIIVRISEFANFSGDVITANSGKIRGVLTKFGSTFQFMVRTKKDIQLNNPRLEIDFYPPVGGTSITYLGSFTENFESYTSGTVTTGQRIFPRYVNDPNQGGNYWYVEAFNSNKYLKMSAFSTNVNFQFPVNKVYFAMPVNFTAANSMSFRTQDRFNNGGVLKVYHTTNYVPLANMNTATLTDITSNFTIASGNTGSASQPFVNSGVYNFPAALTGNGFIIFEYTGGYTSNITTTMHLDDVVVN